MSTQVAASATAIEPAVVTSAATESTAAPVEAEAPPPAAVAPAVESHDDAAAATSPAHGKKRSPFGELKNRLFHKSTSPTRAKGHEHAAATEETPKENAPIATEHAATATPVPEAEVVPAAATTEGEATAAAPVAETPVHHDEEAHKKPKSPGVFEKVKSFFGENKKDKKVKTPTEEKAEPHLTTDAPVAAPAEGDTAPAPAETATAPVTAPETVAVAEATANTTAPVPQVIEPIPEPINEPSTAAEISTSAAAEPETAATAAPATAGTEVKPEGEGAAKVGEQAKTDEKAPKRDIAKLSRRLSAKVGALLHSPKKEKKEKDVALHVEGGDTALAEAAPKIETAVDESKLDTTATTTAAAKSEPVGASASAAEPIAVVETAPVQLEAAPATETKTAVPAAVPVVAASA